MVKSSVTEWHHILPKLSVFILSMMCSMSFNIIQLMMIMPNKSIQIKINQSKIEMLIVSKNLFLAKNLNIGWNLYFIGSLKTYFGFIHVWTLTKKRNWFDDQACSKSMYNKQKKSKKKTFLQYSLLWNHLTLWHHLIHRRNRHAEGPAHSH